jgi:TRAP-type C4-dicarboxylate transport system substrate-binding protein
MRHLLLAISTLALPVAAPAQAVTVKLGTLAPAGSAWHDALKEMAQRWEEISGGRVRLKVYPGGVQGS